jgi:hypothetical protein
MANCSLKFAKEISIIPIFFTALEFFAIENKKGVGILPKFQPFLFYEIY